MADTYVVSGTYNGTSFTASAVIGDDEFYYFSYGGQFYRVDVLSTVPDTSYTWVEVSHNYQRNQYWSVVEGFNVSISSSSGSSAASNAMVENAVQWAIDTANDDTHGYDWENRLGPDYDCSSFVCTAFNQAGFDVTPSWTTTAMRNGFENAGFEVLSSEIANDVNQLQRGDVLLHDIYHTSIYIGNGQQVAAHINELGDVVGGQTGDQTGEEICVSEYSIYSYPSAGVYGWLCALRYPTGTEGEWHEGCRFSSYEIGGVAGWNGTPVEADSMGVAVPWNHGSVPPNPEFPELYYGQLLQIEVGDFSGVVLVNDCGNFGDSNDYNNDVDLDLQPGVWAAAGGGMVTYDNCRWRVVGHIDSDTTNGKGPWYV